MRDMNLMRKQLHVRRTLVRTSDGYKEDSPTSETSIRAVPLMAPLVAELTEYLAEHPRAADPRAADPRAADPTASLWPGRNYGGYGDYRRGLDWFKRMDYNLFYRRRFRDAAEAIGQPELRFHDPRRTAASLFAGSGMPLARVARVLGNAEAATTYKVYLHFFPDDFAADINRLDAYLAADRGRNVP